MCAICNWISKINNTQIDNAKDLGVVMPMYDLIEFSDNYYGRLRQYYRNESNTTLISSEFFKCKVKTTRKKLPAAGKTKDVNLGVSLK